MISCSIRLDPMENAISEQNQSCRCNSESACKALMDEENAQEENDDETDDDDEDTADDETEGDKIDVEKLKEQLKEELKAEIIAELETELYDRLYNDLLEKLRSAPWNLNIKNVFLPLP